MSKWLPRVVVAGIGFLFVAGGGALAQPQPPGDERPPARRDQPPPRPAPDQEAAGILRQTYDSLTLVRAWMSSSLAKLPQEDAALADQAEDFYRTASQAYKNRDYARASLMAMAAGDASRGLLSVLHANTTPPPNLPAPPEMPAPPAGTARGSAPPPRGNAGREGEPPAPPERGGEAAPPPAAAGGPGAARTPKDMAREVLRAAYRGIGDAEKTNPDTKAARLFLDASRRAYDQGRKAYDAGDYGKSLDLAAGAEAWSHVGEDLKRAANPKGADGSRAPGAPASGQPERP